MLSNHTAPRTKHIVFTALMLGMGCTTALPTRAGDVVTLRMADYGVLPETEELPSAIDYVLHEISLNVVPDMAPEDTLKLLFEPGTYNFHVVECPELICHVSNHDQGQPKPVALALDGWHNLVVDGQGAEFLFHGSLLPIAVKNCAHVTLQNFSVDFPNPQIAQVTIKAVTPEGTLFEPEEWVHWNLSPHDNSFICQGDGWERRPVSGIAFDSLTKHILYRTSDLDVRTRGSQVVGDNLVLAPEWRDTRLTPGTKVAMRTWLRPAPGIFLDECLDVSLKNVTVYYAEGMGLLAQRTCDICLEGFNVCLREGGGRYFTTQADATHFSQCRGKLSCDGGVFEGMMDDAINVHGVYLAVEQRLDNHTLLLAYKHEQAWGFRWADEGDSVAFLKARTMEAMEGTFHLTSIKAADDENNPKTFLATFEETLPEEIGAEGTAWGAEDLTWHPEVTFTHNIVRNNRARGALFSSPRHTVCSDNLFDHVSGSAILLCGDCNGWYESGAVRDLEISRNTFDNALTNMFQFTNAVISISPEIPDLEGQKQAFHGGQEKAIRIEDNKFLTFGTPLLYAKSVDGLLFRNNTVEMNEEYEPFIPDWQQQVKLEKVTRYEGE